MPSLTRRDLPREEWPRLAGTELESIWPVLPEDARIVSVEDGDRIVGCWGAFWQLHAEGVWIAPDHRGHAAVARHLLTGMRRIARESGARTVATAGVTEDVIALLRRFPGAIELPGTHVVLPC